MQFAKKQIVSVETSTDMAEVCALMAKYHYKKLPVVEDGKLIGIINRSDITSYVVDSYQS